MVDGATGAILATQDMAEFAAIFVRGSAGDDSLTIDETASLPEEMIISFAGGAGTRHARDRRPRYHLDNDGAISWAGKQRVSFTSVEILAAGPGTDNLIGPADNSAWYVSGEGTGTVSHFGFSGFENLTGAANNEDVFTFGPSGRLAGRIAGGDGGFDTLVTEGTLRRLATRQLAPTRAA